MARMLSVEDRDVLELAAERITSQPEMEREIWARFWWPPAQYFDRLLELVEHPEARRLYPATCERVLEQTTST